MRRAEVAAFLKYYIENVGTLAEKGGYVAPTADDQAENLEERCCPWPASGGGNAEARHDVGEP